MQSVLANGIIFRCEVFIKITFNRRAFPGFVLSERNRQFLLLYAFHFIGRFYWVVMELLLQIFRQIRDWKLFPTAVVKESDPRWRDGADFDVGIALALYCQQWDCVCVASQR